MTPQRPTLRAVTGAPETAAERAARQSAEARASASEALADLLVQLTSAQAATYPIAALDSLPPGIRDRLTRMAERLNDDLQGLSILSGRIRP